MEEFYKIAGTCTTWYQDASNKFASDTADMGDLIKGVVKHRHIVMNYAKEEFHKVKGHLFNIINALVDAQLKISNVDAYMAKRVKLMTKKIDNSAWKFQLKYSKGVGKYCSSYMDRVAEYSGIIEKETKAIAKKMNAITVKFRDGAQAHLDEWNCSAMYPKPKPVDLGVPGWLGGITKAAS